MRIVYFDCSFGAAGDMILGALLDAGASIEPVRAQLETLAIEGWELETKVVTRGGMRATRAVVSASETPERRNYRDIMRILQAAELDRAVAERAIRAFTILAKAEGKVHGKPHDEVHFHEVGGIDAIVDIVGACAALDQFSPDRVVTSPVATGSGIVQTAAGKFPLPAPAVTEIFVAFHAPMFGRGRRELVTPTGAALLAALTDEFGAMPLMRVEASGYGAGERDDGVGNVVRVLAGKD